MQTTEEALEDALRTAEAVRSLQKTTRESIERCEKLPSITTQRLLNLPVKMGKAVEH